MRLEVVVETAVSSCRPGVETAAATGSNKSGLKFYRISSKEAPKRAY